MFRKLAAAFFSWAIAGPALADRHCGPVIDSFYQARQAALDESLSCTAALPQIRQRLAEAVAQARICGCTPLRDGLESALAPLVNSTADAPENCPQMRESVLDAALDEVVKGLVADCH